MSKDDKKITDNPNIVTSKKNDKTSFTINGLQKNAKIFFVGLIIILVGLVVWALIEEQRQNNTVFTIDNKHYSKEEVDKMIAYPVSTGVKKDGAASQAYEYLKRQTAAKKVDFEPSDNEIAAAKKESFKNASDNERNSQWAELVAYDNALEKKLPKKAPLDDVKGYVFVFYFGNLIETGQDWQPPNAGNRNAIAEERKYAQDQASIYHKQLQDKAEAPSEALAKLQADPKLNYQYKSNNNTMSTRLDPGQAEYNSLPSDIEDYVAGSAPIGISPIRVGKTYRVTDYKNPTKMESRETYYYFTVIDNKGVAAKASAFNKTLSSIGSSYKGYSK